MSELPSTSDEAREPVSGPERRRPARDKPGPYDRKKKTGPKAATHKTSAKPVGPQKKENLTLGDWLEVMAYADANPELTQTALELYFRTRPEGALILSQPSISRNLSTAGRAALEKRRLASANAINMKRGRFVVRPDVDHALWIWHQSMQDRGETPDGNMLMAKRAKYEELFDVPPNERMTSRGWLPKFTAAYGLKEHRRHGEAGSVDLEAVAKERERLKILLAQYSDEDTLNFDESGLYIFAVPDRGFSTKRMSGRKQNKKRITIGFLVSRSGERYEPFFIGNAASPRCFKKKKAKSYGLLYRSNKKAWMTGALFDEYIRDLDSQFRRQKRKVLLLLDNFSGHNISYKPTHIRIEFFELNMTSFIQPLDAGSIRNFKSAYRLLQSLRAIDLDEAGAEDLFKMDVLEAMLMAKSAWSKVTAETIRNCWRHTGILPTPSTATVAASTPNPTPSTSSASSTPSANSPNDPQTRAWSLVREFSSPTCPWTLPDLMSRVESALGPAYHVAEWQTAFDIANEPNDDLAAVDAALDGEETKRRGFCSRPCAVQPAPALPTTRYAASRDRESTETELLEALGHLHKRNRLHGQPITLDECLDDPDEREIGASDSRFPSDDANIVAAAKRAVEAGYAGRPILVEDDSDEDEEDDDPAEEEPLVSFKDLQGMCEMLEKASISHADAIGVDALLLQSQLRKLRGHLQRAQAQTAQQTTLTNFFK